MSFARGLAEIECDPRVDSARLTAVSGDEAAALIPIVALLRGDPQAVLAAGAGSWIERLRGQARGDAVTALWRGLAYLAAGQATQAAETLGARTNSTLPGGAEAVRIFYHGLALVASGDRPGHWPSGANCPSATSSREWQAAVASAYTSQVRADLQAGRWSEVVKATDSAFALTGPSPQQPAMLTAAIVARNRLANEAVARGAWAEAIPHWQHLADLAGVCASPWARADRSSTILPSHTKRRSSGGRPPKPGPS